MSVNNVQESGNYNPLLDAMQRTVADTNSSQQSDGKVSTQIVAQSLPAGTTRQAGQVEPEKDAVEEASKVDNQTIVKQLEVVNEQLSLQSKNLVFEFDDINDPPIVKVVDSESGDIIREIPAKELREIAQVLDDIADNMGSKSGKMSNQISSGILINAEL